jgi:hypothetical protein
MKSFSFMYVLLVFYLSSVDTHMFELDIKWSKFILKGALDSSNLTLSILS